MGAYTWNKMDQCKYKADKYLYGGQKNLGMNAQPLGTLISFQNYIEYIDSLSVQDKKYNVQKYSFLGQ